MDAAINWNNTADIQAHKAGSVYYAASSSKTKSVAVTMGSVLAYETGMKYGWPDFQSFANSIQSMWKIKFNRHDWTSSTCTCPSYQKQYYCKHWIGIAIKKKVLTPSVSTSTEILVKPSRGRPKDRDVEETQAVVLPAEAPTTKRGPGRPRLAGPALTFDNPRQSATTTTSGRPPKRPLSPSQAPATEHVPQAKRGRGRPPKRPLPPSQAPPTEHVPQAKRGRDRPRKK